MAPNWKPSEFLLLALLPLSLGLPSSPLAPRIIVGGGSNGGVVDTSYEHIACASNTTGTSSTPQVRWTNAQADIASSTLGREYTFNTAVRQQAQGRYDNFASIFFSGPSGANLNCGIANSDCGSGPSINCPANMNAAGWEILTSFTSLDHVMNNIVDAFNTAMGGIDVAQATSDFFPAPPSTFDEQLILSCVAGVLGLLGGLLGLAEGAALAGALIGGISSGALGAAGTALGAPTTPGNLTTAFSTISETTNSAYNTFASDIFSTGATNTSSVTMNDLMANGNLLVEPDFQTEYNQNEFSKSIYAQLAVAAWAQTSGLTPFITWDDAACGSVASPILNQPTNIPGTVMDADLSKVGVTNNGRCYYLLGAQTIDSCSGPKDSSKRLKTRVQGPGNQPQNPNPDNGTPSTGPKKTSCWDIVVLPGGSTDVLTGASNVYNGLQIDDFINGAVAGWTAAGSTNGYPPLSSMSTTYPKSIQDAGFITQIPVCNYIPVNGQANKNAGKGCPDLTATAS